MSQPLRIALLVYRGKPHVGGQGVYTKHLANALVADGHHVEVFSGPPYPELDEDRVVLHRVRGLDLYRDHDPFRLPWPNEITSRTDLGELMRMCTGGFPEPWAFSMRVADLLAERVDDFDVVHDNQCLGDGLLRIAASGIPVLGTIHHPITVDRRVELAHARSPWKQLSMRRWYGFTKMQSRVARQLPLIVTVSESSRADIVAGHGIDPDRLRVVNVGVDPTLWRPLDGVARVPGRLMTTTSSDVPMKGLVHLLEALAKVRTERTDAHLVVIGRPSPGGPVMRTIERLGLADAIEFVRGPTDQQIVDLYAEAELAIVPSLYEGFSLPAVEAMAAGVPLVATTGGAVPEVVGADGTTAALVPPGDAGALTTTILELLADPARRAAIGAAGRTRAVERYSWTRTARETVALYRQLIEASRPAPVQEPA